MAGPINPSDLGPPGTQGNLSPGGMNPSVLRSIISLIMGGGTRGSYAGAGRGAMVGMGPANPSAGVGMFRSMVASPPPAADAGPPPFPSDAGRGAMVGMGPSDPNAGVGMLRATPSDGAVNYQGPVRDNGVPTDPHQQGDRTPPSISPFDSVAPSLPTAPPGESSPPDSVLPLPRERPSVPAKVVDVDQGSQKHPSPGQDLKIGAMAAAKDQAASDTGRTSGDTGGGGAAPGLPRLYRVRQGDTLTAIAQRLYGDPNKWRQIAAANKMVVSNPNKILYGQSLVLPTNAGKTQGMKPLRGVAPFAQR